MRAAPFVRLPVFAVASCSKSLAHESTRRRVQLIGGLPLGLLPGRGGAHPLTLEVAVISEHGVLAARFPSSPTLSGEWLRSPIHRPELRARRVLEILTDK